MPIYTYKCNSCYKVQDAVRTVENRNDTPNCECGGKTLKIIIPPMVAPQFQAYKAVAGDQRVIRSRTEHKNFLSENGLEEVGNDTSIKPE